MRKELEDLVNELSKHMQVSGSLSLKHPDSQAFTDPKTFSQNLRNWLNEIRSIGKIETLVFDVEGPPEGKKSYSILTISDQQKIKTEGVGVYDEIIEKKDKSKKEPKDLVIFRKQAMLYVIAALAGIEDIDGTLKEENTIKDNYDVLAKLLKGTTDKRLTILSNFLEENKKYIVGSKQAKQIDDDAKQVEDDDPEQRIGRRVKFAKDVTIFRYEDTDDEPINPNANKETISAKSWEDQQRKEKEEFNPTGKDVFTAAREGTLNIGDANAPTKERTPEELRNLHRDRRASRRNLSIGTTVDTSPSVDKTLQQKTEAQSVDSTSPQKTEQSVDNKPPQKTETPVRRGHTRNRSTFDFTSTIGSIPSEKSSSPLPTSETEKSSSPLPTEKKLSNPPPTETDNLDKEKRDKQPSTSASKQEETEQSANQTEQPTNQQSGPKT